MVRVGQEKYFIVKKERITPTLNETAWEEQDNHWRSLVFPNHGDTVAFINTALRLICYSKPPIFTLPSPTWNLSDEET